MLYVAGLLACFRCHLDFRSDTERSAVYGDSERRPELIERVRSMLSERPLGLIAQFLIERPELHAIGARLFGAYDSFLELLHDSNARKILDGPPNEDYTTNETYIQARGLSHTFRDAVLDLFFDEPSGLYTLTRLYGVF